jgi:hypothetical protein
MSGYLFKKHNSINLNYYISNINLLRSSLVNDLDVLFDSHLLFENHILTIQIKALFLFGMIKCNCSEFNDPFTQCYSPKKGRGYTMSYNIKHLYYH